MIVLFLLILAEVFRNWYMIVKLKTEPTYFQSFIFRGMASIAHGIYLDLVYGIFPPIEELMTLSGSLLALAPLLILQTSVFYTLFDPLLNKARGLNWDYIGKHSGWLDRLGFSRPSIYWVFKTVVAIIAILSILLNLRLWF